MSLKCEAPHEGGASRKCFGGRFRDTDTSLHQDRQSQLWAHVREYVPNASGEELKQRVSLLATRDMAAALRGRTECSFAQNLSCEAHELAGGFVFAANETTQRLTLAAKLARHLVVAAVLAEQLDERESDHG